MLHFSDKHRLKKNTSACIFIETQQSQEGELLYRTCCIDLPVLCFVIRLQIFVFLFCPSRNTATSDLLTVHSSFTSLCSPHVFCLPASFVLFSYNQLLITKSCSFVCYATLAKHSGLGGRTFRLGFQILSQL